MSNKEVELTYSIDDRKVYAKVIENNQKIEVKNENLPKELKNIDSPVWFKAFLENAYIKVTNLNDGHYKLEINQRIIGGMLQEHSNNGSITPRTVGQQEAINSNSLANAYLSSIEKLEKMISKMVTKYQENLNGKREFAADKPSTLRFSIIVEQLGILSESSLHNQVLHPIEVEIFNNAIKKLNQCNIEDYRKARRENYPILKNII